MCRRRHQYQPTISASSSTSSLEDYDLATPSPYLPASTQQCYSRRCNRRTRRPQSHFHFHSSTPSTASSSTSTTTSFISKQDAFRQNTYYPQPPPPLPKAPHCRRRAVRRHSNPLAMAALLLASIGLGAEKIREKREERKARKAGLEWESERAEERRRKRKEEEKRRVEERGMPPSYEEVVGGGVGRERSGGGRGSMLNV
ncbi:hypothetical protein BS50DRAFT_673233 [Corynespora cassiicola Philippines]|uniref:Uncharacterized protein n=1 Tax=Corynespora cassiicola Philippines TaxID=1448308 RepID=A0A2T2P458_CORCC|nr:hypothetical protein BS50DRAFT_673233 [Corynespora cassiicola Philippines]